MNTAITIATYAENKEELVRACRLGASLRKFGGRFAGSDFVICVPQHKVSELRLDEAHLQATRIMMVDVPENVRWLFYAGKPFAAAAAEAQLASSSVIVWLDNDTIVLAEPDEFELGAEISIAYRPVMHNRSGSLWNCPPDPYWKRIYELLELRDALLFPVVSQADRQEIRAYFQAGSLVVRPTSRILHRWRENLQILSSDELLVEMCRADRNRWVFLHQTALVGAVIHSVERRQMQELSERYSYPIFFDRQYESLQVFDSIENVATMRCVISFRALGSDWPKHLKGTTHKIDWLGELLADEG